MTIQVSQKLLIDLVGQLSLLAPAAVAWGFLYTADDTSQANLIKYGYKEAIEEGLKEEYPVEVKIVESDGERTPGSIFRGVPKH